mgnify:CR=1 FL=1
MTDSFLAEQNRECWGALDFLDDHMKPTTKQVVIESVGEGVPPGGGKSRVYFVCKGDTRKMFLKDTARTLIAYKLGTKSKKDIVGCALKITVKMARSPKGGEVFSMTVLDACYPKSRTHPAADAAPEEQSAPNTQQQPPPKPLREPGDDDV